MQSAVIVFPGSNCDRDMARAIELVLALPSRPSFIMKYSAEPKLARIAKNATMTRYFMEWIIP